MWEFEGWWMLNPPRLTRLRCHRTNNIGRQGERKKKRIPKVTNNDEHK